MKKLVIAIAVVILMSSSVVATGNLSESSPRGNILLASFILENGDAVIVTQNPQPNSSWGYIAFEFISLDGKTRIYDKGQMIPMGGDAPVKVESQACGGYVSVTTNWENNIMLYRWAIPNPTNKIYLPIVCQSCE